VIVSRFSDDLLVQYNLYGCLALSLLMDLFVLSSYRGRVLNTLTDFFNLQFTIYICLSSYFVFGCLISGSKISNNTEQELYT
jgi:hypothetical protein